MKAPAARGKNMSDIMAEKRLWLNVPLWVIRNAVFLYITFTSFYIQKSSQAGSTNLIFIEKVKPDFT
ncbi:hypothetical protein D6029_13695 [Buttiauxella izardii]|uniref:Uncharacterized protein n=1 Tax=Buttiauxella izardii TaxID=82991 RepID=A0A3A5JVD2_9ENTR|nr:hypothetical protein D6029_13695 [Buttiauxella izardii]